ncbi:MAG: 3-alpha,7-alpha,12-alpha-trihydroxy-5-beta-cholest-24-enoyl-CoA hydratase, partial [Sphingomonadales bacterium]
MPRPKWRSPRSGRPNSRDDNMAVDYDTLMALRVPDATQRYTAKDTMLYALGIGMGADPMDEAQLRFVYEKDLRAVPTQAIVLALPGMWVRESGLDYSKIVHGEQSAEFHAPIPSEGEVTGALRIVDVIDKGEGKGALVYAERVLTDTATGTKLATIRQTIFARGDSGIGGPGNAQPPVHVLPDRAPDGMVSLPTVPQQALIYRLSGDYNPLHAEPATAQRVGFPKPILHGLATFGVAAHALLKGVCEYDPDRLASIAGRFTAPVF